VIAFVSDKDLCLVLQPPESGRVNDPVTVALELGSRRADRFYHQPPAA